MKVVNETDTAVTLAIEPADVAMWARARLASGEVTDPLEREAWRLLGYPPLRLVRPDDPQPPRSRWEFGRREPCAGGHAGDLECEPCRGDCLGGAAL